MFRYNIRSILALLLCTLFLPTLALSQTQQDKSPPAADPTPILVELFTSEGCSSCPPADALIQSLDTRQPIGGAQLIVLSEHVTYWDHDGWTDPNSSAAFTDRQAAYEQVLHHDTAFTPQIIVDGTEEIPNTNRAQKAEAVLERARAAQKIPVRIALASVDGANPSLLRLHVETGEDPDNRNAEVYVAVALDRVETQVLHGENGGRRLVHVAVVEELTKIGKLSKGKGFAPDVELKLKPGTDSKGLRLIAFVQKAGPGEVLGAALRKPAI